MAFPLEFGFSVAVDVGVANASTLSRQGVHGVDAQLLSFVAAQPAPATLQDVIAERIPLVTGPTPETVGSTGPVVGGAQTLATVPLGDLAYAGQAVRIASARPKLCIGARSAPVPLPEYLVTHRVPAVAGCAFEWVVVAPSLPDSRETFAPARSRSRL